MLYHFCTTAFYFRVELNDDFTTQPNMNIQLFTVAKYEYKY